MKPDEIERAQAEIADLRAKLAVFDLAVKSIHGIDEAVVFMDAATKEAESMDRDAIIAHYVCASVNWALTLHERDAALSREKVLREALEFIADLSDPADEHCDFCGATTSEHASPCPVMVALAALAQTKPTTASNLVGSPHQGQQGSGKLDRSSTTGVGDETTAPQRGSETAACSRCGGYGKITLVAWGAGEFVPCPDCNAKEEK